MKTIRLFLATSFAFLSAGMAWAQPALVAEESEIRFSAKQLGVSVSGEFQEFDAELQFDPQNLENSRVKITVDTGSATMYNREADDNLNTAPWFSAADFPQATFESSNIREISQGRYEAEGTLTIKGVSSDVVVPVQLEQSGELTTATGSLPLKRLTFNVGEGEWADTGIVADDVHVGFKLTLTGVEQL